MTTAAPSGSRLPGLRPLGWISAVSLTISAIGLGVWSWMITHRDALPSLEDRTGKNLLRQYQASSHDTWLILLALACISLVVMLQRARNHSLSGGRRSQSEGPIRDLFRFAKEQPAALVLFVVYTVVMVQGTTWLYPELVGWYKDVIDEQLLNNFSIRAGFIGETMKRDDFRFFPLAHQDLHVLSWFTAYVKVWMLVSAAELITIVVLATRFIRRLNGHDAKRGPALLLITALLLMLHPATASGFFQFIYCERFLTFIFAFYIAAYLHHQRTGSLASFYSACLFGLLGIYIKDVAIVLFIGPPLLTLLLGSLGWINGYPRWGADTPANWLTSYRLELWLAALLPIFLCSYIVLSLLPSTYVSQGAYGDNKTIVFEPDWRFWFLTLISTARLLLAAIQKIRLHLLDCLNFSALAYAAALLLLIGFQSSKYLTLPVQLVTVLDLTWFWSAALAPRLNRALPWRATASLGSMAALALIGMESAWHQPSFATTVHGIKRQQASWFGAYNAASQQARLIRRNGEPVNIIYNKISWLSRKRHLGRLHYDRLIEYNPETKTYLIEDGINQGGVYTPQPGDLVINIDKTISSLTPILKQQPARLLFRFDERDNSGAIYRLQP